MQHIINDIILTALPVVCDIVTIQVNTSKARVAAKIAMQSITPIPLRKNNVDGKYFKMSKIQLSQQNPGIQILTCNTYSWYTPTKHLSLYNKVCNTTLVYYGHRDAQLMQLTYMTGKATNYSTVLTRGLQ